MKYKNNLERKLENIIKLATMKKLVKLASKRIDRMKLVKLKLLNQATKEGGTKEKESQPNKPRNKYQQNNL